MDRSQAASYISQGRLRSNQTGNLLNTSNIYEQSPRTGPVAPMILAQGEAGGPTAWTASTDQNLRNYIQQRAAKRMKEIDQEAEQAS